MNIAYQLQRDAFGRLQLIDRDGLLSRMWPGG